MRYSPSVRRWKTQESPPSEEGTGALGTVAVSVVVPIYNETENIPELVDRLTKVLGDLNRTHEIIFVNDGSRDGSLELLIAAQQMHPEITIVDFNRNFGQHAAVFAGFEASTGDVVVTIDADLQNPPEEIPKLIAEFDKGHDVVGTIRLQRQDSLLRKFFSAIINRTTAKLTGIRLKDYGCMLRAYRRDVVDAMGQAQEISTFIPALAASLGSNPTEIEVAHSGRAGGRSKYNIFRLISLQFDLITSFSLKPIRALIFLGVTVSLLGMGFGVYLLFRRLLLGPESEGLFTLFAILFVLVGAQFLAFGLLGEYIGRIYLEVRDRPRFIVRRFYPRKESGEDAEPSGAG